jgi:polysaccharide biosynthesis/export protein
MFAIHNLRMSMVAFAIVIPALVVFGNSTADATQNQPQDPSSVPTRGSTADSAPNPEPLNIGCGDLLDISVYDLPEMKHTVRVDSNGNISFSLVGSLHAAGLSTTELEARLEKLLMDGGYVTKPQVSVLILEYATQGISVSGEVNKPGIYPALGPRRLMDIISAAGGLTEKAGGTVAFTRTDRPNTPEVVTLSRNPMGALQNNVQVFPGDTIVVSRAGVVYVVGEVGKPSGFTMDKNETLTVLQALALAEGVKSTASFDRAKLIRRSPDGVTEIPINLKQILAGRSPDRTLQPEDIIFVPTSMTKSAARRTVDSIVQIATGVAIYRR